MPKFAPKLTVASISPVIDTQSDLNKIVIVGNIPYTKLEQVTDH